MNLNIGGLTDARQKGNLSRFANHSCEPNTTVVLLNDYSDVSNPRNFFLRANSRIEKGDNRIEFPCLCMTQSCVNGKRTQLAAVAVMDTDLLYMAWARQALARYSCEGHAFYSRIYKSELLDPISSYVTSPRCVAVLASPVALISSCIEALAFSFTLEELSLILEQSYKESHAESLSCINNESFDCE